MLSSNPKAKTFFFFLRKRFFLSIPCDVVLAFPKTGLLPWVLASGDVEILCGCWSGASGQQGGEAWQEGGVILPQDLALNPGSSSLHFC